VPLAMNAVNAIFGGYIIIPGWAAYRYEIETMENAKVV